MFNTCLDPEKWFLYGHQNHFGHHFLQLFRHNLQLKWRPRHVMKGRVHCIYECRCMANPPPPLLIITLEGEPIAIRPCFTCNTISPTAHHQHTQSRLVIHSHSSVVKLHRDIPEKIPTRRSLYGYWKMVFVCYGFWRFARRKAKWV